MLLSFKQKPQFSKENCFCCDILFYSIDTGVAVFSEKKSKISIIQYMSLYTQTQSCQLSRLSENTSYSKPLQGDRRVFLRGVSIKCLNAGRKKFLFLFLKNMHSRNDRLDARLHVKLLPYLCKTCQPKHLGSNGELRMWPNNKGCLLLGDGYVSQL